MQHLDSYFLGEKLYGDDFTSEEIEKWYKDEKEAYAELGSKDKENYQYNYHTINLINGFSKLPKDKVFNKVLGIGSAFGYEFEPIKDRIQNLVILEPSDQLISGEVFGIPTTYKKPEISGKIHFPDQSFDLVICFGVLHHVPNVSFVLHEIHRCLKPRGYFLLREPITSMGDWRYPRPGLTKRERGIPLNIFRNIIRKLNFEVVRERFCFFPHLTYHLVNLLKYPVYKHKFMVYLDNLFSALFAWNIRYHRVNKWQRISPTNVFYVLQKK